MHNAGMSSRSDNHWLRIPLPWYMVGFCLCFASNCHELRWHCVAFEGASCTTSSLSAHIWKIKCAVGDVVESEDDVLVILEAMKTEVNVTAGEENVGRRVVGFGQGVREGSIVQAGAPLVYFK